MDTLNVIISGVAVFILGEIIVRFFLTPIHKFKEIKGEIASVLLFHANNYGQVYKNLDGILGTEGRDDRVIKERIEYFKDLLTKRLEKLLAEAGKTVGDMSDEEETFPDPTDRASLESDRNFLLRIRDRERKLIVKIEEALDRIENDTFGICEMCGEEISEERLQARPVTTQCIDCKTEEEEKEKIGSH